MPVHPVDLAVRTALLIMFTLATLRSYYRRKVMEEAVVHFLVLEERGHRAAMLPGGDRMATTEAVVAVAAFRQPWMAVTVATVSSLLNTEEEYECE